MINKIIPKYPCLHTIKNIQMNNMQNQNFESSNQYSSSPLQAFQDKLIARPRFSPSSNIIKENSQNIARQLKNQTGTLDQKLAKAKDIILTDLGLNPNLLKLVDEDCGPGVYAMSSPTRGIIKFNKKLCQQPNSQFSDNAVLCILRHEIDHVVVFTKIYKQIGSENFEKLIQSNDYLKTLPPEERVINHKFYQEMSNYIDISDFDAKPYIEGFNNYNKGVDNTGINYSNFRLFTMITKNFDNELENSARKVQYALEEQMGVTTLKDFYSMIDNTKALKTKISDYLVKNPLLKDGDDTEEILFDYLYHKSAVELELEDKTQNWGKIIKNAENKVQFITKTNIIDARKYSEEKLASSKNS